MEVNTGFSKVIALVVVVLMFLRKTTAFTGEYDKKCYDSCFRSCVDEGNIPWKCSSHCMDACTSKFDAFRDCHAGCLLQNCNQIMDDEVKRNICSKECSNTQCNPKHFKSP